MKLPSLILAAASLCVLSPFPNPALAADKVSKETVPAKKQSVEMIKDGQAMFVIVTADEPTGPARDAVNELNYWMERITGTRLPVTTVSGYDKKRPYIAVGPSQLTADNGWSTEPFAQEEARIFIEPTRIGLIGNDKAPYEGVEWSGSYYAVLELVHKALGVRWIWPGALGEVFTPTPTLAVKVDSWSWKPTITLNRTLRNGYGTSKPERFKEYIGLEVDTAKWQQLFDQQSHWLKRERMNRASNVKFGHAFGDWWDLYHQDHPDWFARPPEGSIQRGGKGVKLNISNPEVAAKIISDWKEAWTSDPATNKYVNVAPNDSRGYDTRPETRAWDAPEMSSLSDKEIYSSDIAIVSDRYAKFWNILAKQVREIDPEARLSTYAYRNYRKPPLHTEKLENNIVIGYVGGEGYYPDERFIVDEWTKWASLGAGLLWRPNLFHSGAGTPYLFSRQLAADFKVFHANALLGTDFDSLTGNWSGQGLNYYVLAELHTRPDAAYKDLCDEYFSAFGPAKEAIARYHEFFEKQTANGPKLMREHHLTSHETWGGWWIAHIRLIPLFLTPDVIEHGAEILEAAKQAVADAPRIYQDRVQFIEKGFIHAKLMAETFRRLNLGDPNQKINPVTSRAILQPLWDHRLAMLTDHAVPIVGLFNLEQRRLGIWAAFVTTDQQKEETTYPIDQNWLIRLDPQSKGIDEKWHDSKAADRAQWKDGAVGLPWRRALAVPESTESQVVWYRTEFQIPELKDTGERTLLRFGSVDSDVKIWVNGTLILHRGYPYDGSYESWSEPFEVDLQKSANPGPGNELVIRVESKSANAGITGKVNLVLKE